MPLSSIIPYVPQRWVVCALCSWALAIISYKNTCFYAIADIVYSVTEKRIKPPEGCPFLFFDKSWEKRTLPFYLPDVYWNPMIIDIADSAFHSGKLLAVVPAGLLSDLGYSKYVLGGGMLLVTAKHLLIPVFIQFGVTAYTVLNFFEGIGEATIYPSIVSLISHWSPLSERNMFTAFVVTGIYYGDTLGHVFFQLIYMGFSSWSIGQYVTGIVGLVWFILFYIFIYSSPDQSPFISHHEYHAITNIHRRRSLLIRLHRLHGIPWRKIVTSLPFLSLVLMFCSLDWAVSLNIYGSLDSYQSYILHLPDTLSHSSMIVFVAGLPSVLIGGFLADWTAKHKLISKTAIKKLFSFISVFCSSVLLVAACFLIGCNIKLFWILTTVSVYSLGLANPVIYSAAVDLNPSHAGLLTGIMSGARTIFSLFNSRMDEILVTDNYNSADWQIRCLFYTALALVMMIPFLFFGSGEKQSWRHSSLVHPDDRPPIQLETVHQSR